MQINLVGSQIKELFDKSQSVLVVLSDSADNDLACLAASLVEVFAVYKKKAVLLTNKELPIAAKPLVKPEVLRSKLTPESLVLSFDWTKGPLDKVSYKIDGNRFDLIINSKGSRINPNDISYSYRGDKYDLAVTVGVKNVQELTNFGLEPTNFETLASINFDKASDNNQFAKLNLVNIGQDGVCAIAANAFKEAKVALPTKAAEIMLVGIREATKNFTEVADPSTFEAAGFLKRCMIPGMVSFEEKAVEKPINSNEETSENWPSPKIFRSRSLS